MDGLFHGKPYEQMDDLGVPLFLETPKWFVTGFFWATCTWVCSHGGSMAGPGVRRTQTVERWPGSHEKVCGRKRFLRAICQVLTRCQKRTGNITKFFGPKRNSRHEVRIHVVDVTTWPCNIINNQYHHVKAPVMTNNHVPGSKTRRHRGCFPFLNAKHHQHKVSSCLTIIMEASKCCPTMEIEQWRLLTFLAGHEKFWSVMQ